jgi:metallo-beta-lactamase family protein
VKITFHGAAQTVTGSRHLISLNGHRLLLDCGLYQGKRQQTYARNLTFPFQPQSIDAVILSHAHIDHIGNVPNLVKQGYAGPLHATLATVHLTDIMLRDAGHIQEDDIEFLNKKRARRGESPVEPLYTLEDAERSIQLLVRQRYDRPFEPVPGVVATLVDAGHILGSAGIVLELEEGGRKVRLMFSGDIGRRRMPLLRDPVLPGDVDYLIMECTYGDQSHDPPEKAYRALRSVIRRTVERGGKIIIPAFAVGRTQELVYFLRQMIDEGEIPRIPVYVDSPLATDVTQVFREHPECLDQETIDLLESEGSGAAFGFDLLTFTRSVEQSKALNDLKVPAVIISASGMAETGRILHHLRNNVEDPRNTVLITSWMAPDTLGRRLSEGQREIKIFGEGFEVKAEVASINGFSAHAGQDFLLTYAQAVKGRARQIFLVHGEPEAAGAFRLKLAEGGITNVAYPALGDTVEI